MAIDSAWTTVVDHGVAMNAKAMLVLCATYSFAGAADTPRVMFDDRFKDWYPEVVDVASAQLTGLPVEPPVVVASPQRSWTATINRTDGAKVAYDQSIGRIDIRSEGQPSTVIRVHGFRTVTVMWVNDRLLHIDLGLGHVASVDAIYDLRDHRWLYQDSISYPPSE